MMIHDFLISYGRMADLRGVLCKHGLDTHFAQLTGVISKYGRSSEKVNLHGGKQNGQGSRTGIPVEFGVGEVISDSNITKSA